MAEQAAERQTVCHPIAPVWNAGSRVLILGTMPSPKSREQGFYYAHPQNRFWRVMAALLGEPVPQGTQERRNFALRSGIALWDVLASCEICGAADSSIRNPVPNDIAALLAKTDIQAVFTTGAAAFRLYQKMCLPQTHLPAAALPSTSPANCRMSFETLCSAYQIILPFLRGSGINREPVGPQPAADGEDR